MRRGIAFVSLPNPPVTLSRVPVPDFSEILGLPISYNQQFKGVAVARGVWPFKHIEVGVSWFGLSMGERIAVLMHEAGHCKLLHLEKRILWLPLFWTKFVERIAMDQELEADEFAFRHGYGVEFLQFLKRFRYVKGDYYPNYPERSEHLKRLMRESGYEVAA